MTVYNLITRRTFFALICGCALLLSATLSALAKDGASSGGGGNSGSGSESGSGNSGSGSDSNSGSGKSDDGDNNGDDADADADNSGKDQNGRDGLDADKIRAAVKSGDAISLSKAYSILRDAKSGRVIQVKLIENGFRLNYRFKVISPLGKVKTISMDAKTGRLSNILGF